MNYRVYNWNKGVYEDSTAPRTRKTVQGIVQSTADYLKSGIQPGSKEPQGQTKERKDTPGVDKDEKVIAKTPSGVIKEITHGTQTTKSPEKLEANEADKAPPAPSRDSSASENRSDVQTPDERREQVSESDPGFIKHKFNEPNEDIKPQKQAATHQETIKKYKSKINDMKHELSTYHAKLGLLPLKDKEIQDLREQLNSALKKQKKSQKDTEKTKKLKEQIHSLELQNRDLAQQLQSSYSQESFHEAEELNKEYELKLDRCQVENQTEKRRLTSELESLQSTNSELEEQIAKLKQSQTTADNLKAENSKLEEQIAQLKKQGQTSLESLKSANIILEEEVTQLKQIQSSLDNLKATNTQLEEQIAQLKQVQSTLDNLKAENSKLQQEITQLKQSQTTLDNLKAENSKLQQEIAQLKQDQTTLNNLKATNAKLEEQITQLNQGQSTLDNLKAENTKLEQEITQLKQGQTTFHNLNAENAKLEKEIAQLKRNQTALSALKSTNSRLEVQLTQLRNELANRDHRLKLISEEFSKSQQRLKQMQATEHALKQPIPAPRIRVNPFELETAEIQISSSLEQAPPPSAEAQLVHPKMGEKPAEKHKAAKEGPPPAPPLPHNFFGRRPTKHYEKIPPPPPLPRVYEYELHQHYTRPHVK